MIERTVLSQDVQSILRQNDKILDLNREVFELIKESYKPLILDTSKLNIDEIKPGSIHRVSPSQM